MNLKNDISYRWIIFAAFIFSQLVLSIAGYGWGVLAPFFKESMSLNSTQLGLIGSTFYLTAAFSAFPAGIITDRFGVKTGFLLWLGLTGLPLLLAGMVQSCFILFLLIIAISGSGYGMGNPVSSKGLFLWFDKNTRGLVFGIKQAGVTVGAAAAGVLLVYLSRKFGPFIALVIIGSFISFMFVVVFFLYRDPVKDNNLSQSDTKKSEEPEQKPSAFFNLRSIITNRLFLYLCIIMAILGLLQGIIVTFFILYITESHGYPLMMAGTLFSTIMLSGAIGRILWGLTSDRLFDGRRKPVLIIIAGLAVFCITSLAFWSAAIPKFLLYGIAVCVGLSALGWNSICLLMVTEITDKDKTATFVGLASTIAWFGLACGPLAFGILTDYCGYYISWITLAVICICNLILIFALPISKTADSNI